MLRERQSEWIKALTEPHPVDAFLIPDAALLETLRPAAKDLTLTAKALAGPLTVETLEALVLLRNPKIQSKEGEFKAVLEGYSQAEDLDTVLRRYAGFTKGVMTGVGGMTNPDPMIFKFPFPGVLALKGEIVTQEAQAAWEEVEVTRRDAVTAIRRDHAELLYVHQALAITRSQLKLLVTLHEAVSARYEAGKTSFKDLTSISVEQEKVSEELITLGEERKNSESLIRAALSLPEPIDIGIPVHPKPIRGTAKLEKLYTLATASRQELKAQRALLGRTERMLELAETMVYPAFSQELTLFEGDAISRIEGGGLQSGARSPLSMAGSNGSFPVTATASNGSGLPKMPWFGTDDAYLRQTRLRIDSLKKELEAALAATTLGVRKAWFAVDKAKREAALYRERVIPLTKANLDAATQGYAADQLGFAELIESANAWLGATLALARAESDLLVAQAELSAAVGVDQ
jgi:outer membrane protein TolC